MAAKKYEHVKEILRKRIRADYRVGSKIPSTMVLHKKLGVSPQTVNRAIRDLTDEGILERRAGVGTFVTRPQSSTRDIALGWGEASEILTQNPYCARILHAVQTEAGSRDRQLLVATNVHRAEPPFLARGREVAGIILLLNHDVRLVDAYLERGTPVVLVDPYVRVAGVPFVTNDHFSGMRQATAHLVALGHRRIVHATANLPWYALILEERILGYESAMREAGLEEMCLVYRSCPIAEDPETSKAFVEMLDSVQPTACCCANDDMAAFAIGICHDHGIRVPEDLSVAGYDDSGVAAHLRPSLTTVHVPLEEIGRTAVRILDRLIEEHQLTGTGTIYPVSLVERGSTRRLSSLASQRASTKRTSADEPGGENLPSS